MNETTFNSTMSSSLSLHQDADQTTKDAPHPSPPPAAPVIPLVAASSQNKKQTSKQKLRVRPIRTLQKNTTQRKVPPSRIGLPKSSGGGSGDAKCGDRPNTDIVSQPMISSTSSVATNTPPSSNNEDSTGGNHLHDAVEKPSTNHHRHHPDDANSPSREKTTVVVVPPKKQIGSKPSSSSVKKSPAMLHKRSMKHCSHLRTTNNVTLSNANARKGLSIHVGSTMVSSRKRPSSLILPTQKSSVRPDVDMDVGVDNHNSNNNTNKDPTMVEEPIVSSEDLLPASELDAVMNAVDRETMQQTTKDPPPSSSSPSSNKDDIVPYQHLGLIDPSLNIAPPKPNEKTMKDFCSKFKLPKVSKNGTTSSATKNGGNHAAVNANLNVQEEEEAKEDHRSGPLVEIINGEIVIQESSIIVGGRRTTEEVDRELEGGIVEEENTALTATYTSFTKREKVKRWTVEETKKFYLVLRQCGTDFSTMESFFNGTDGGNKRSRKELKCKYNRENKKHPELIDMAMNPKAQLPYDLNVFGELNMDSVQDKVVPLGQARVGGISTSSSTASVSMSQEQTPISVTPAPSVVAVGNLEEGGEQGGGNAPVVVSQQETHEMDVESMNDGGDGVGKKDVTGVAMVGGNDAMNLEETTKEDAALDKHLSSIPLLAPGAAKKKTKPKFRAKPKALKRIVK